MLNKIDVFIVNLLIFLCFAAVVGLQVAETLYYFGGLAPLFQ